MPPAMSPPSSYVQVGNNSGALSAPSSFPKFERVDSEQHAKLREFEITAREGWSDMNITADVVSNWEVAQATDEIVQNFQDQCQTSPGLGAAGVGGTWDVGVGTWEYKRSRATGELVGVVGPAGGGGSASGDPGSGTSSGERTSGAGAKTGDKEETLLLLATEIGTGGGKSKPGKRLGFLHWLPGAGAASGSAKMKKGTITCVNYSAILAPRNLTAGHTGAEKKGHERRSKVLGQFGDGLKSAVSVFCRGGCDGRQTQMFLK